MIRNLKKRSRTMDKLPETPSARKAGRPVTGAPFYQGGRWKCRPLFADGKRRIVNLDFGLTDEQAKAAASEIGRLALAGEIEQVEAAKPTDETVSEFVERWLKARKAAGYTNVSVDRGRLAAHVLPILGPMPIRKVTSADVERVRDAIDVAIRDGYEGRYGKQKLLGWKTAENAWGLLTKLFHDARGSKDRTLRVRGDLPNPCADVEGPDRGTRKGRVYLYPSELTALLASEAVPQKWRRLFAVTTYLYLRDGEISVLEWSDVDLEHRQVTISRALQADGTIGPPKNGTARTVPICDALLPLLEQLRRDHPNAIRVLDAPATAAKADRLREYLLRAKATTRPIFTTTTTTSALTFHDLRATGITWCVIRGDDPMKVQSRAGHSDFKVTQLYVREAENLRAGFGDVFPALPESLFRIDAPRKGVRLHQLSRSASKQADSEYRRRGSNPHALAGGGF
jgi:integrase